MLSSFLALLALALPQGALRLATQEPQSPSTDPGVLAAKAARFVPDILAASWTTDSILRFDGETGAFEGTFADGGPLRFPAGLDYGPDGNLYVSSFYWSSILEYDGQTGQFLGTFVPSGTGGLAQPGKMEFRADGLLYVLSSYSGGVLRFDATTGAFHDVLIPAGSGGITTAFAMTFGPDGDIYLGGYYSKTVVRFDGQTGAPERTVAQFVDTPSGMGFRADGVLLVGEWRTGTFFQHNIQRYTAGGEFLGKLTNLPQGPHDFAFDPKGRLYVAGSGGIDVLDPNTGQFLRSMFPPGFQDLMAITFTPLPKPLPER
jgi:streptogramin lyase